jgi:hypothetical protein
MVRWTTPDGKAGLEFHSISRDSQAALDAWLHQRMLEEGWSDEESENVGEPRDTASKS